MKGMWHSTPPISPTTSPIRGLLDLHSSASPHPQGDLCITNTASPSMGDLALCVQALPHPQGEFWSYVPRHYLTLKGIFGLTCQTLSIMLNGHVLHLSSYCLLTIMLWPTNQTNKIFNPKVSFFFPQSSRRVKHHQASNGIENENCSNFTFGWKRIYKMLTNVGSQFDVARVVAFILASRLLVNSSNSQPIPYR